MPEANDFEIRLQALNHAGGDVDKARQIYAFLAGDPAPLASETQKPPRKETKAKSEDAKPTEVANTPPPPEPESVKPV